MKAASADFCRRIAEANDHVTIARAFSLRLVDCLKVAFLWRLYLYWFVCSNHFLAHSVSASCHRIAHHQHQRVVVLEELEVFAGPQ